MAIGKNLINGDIMVLLSRCYCFIFDIKVSFISNLFLQKVVIRIESVKLTLKEYCQQFLNKFIDLQGLIGFSHFYCFPKLLISLFIAALRKKLIFEGIFHHVQHSSHKLALNFLVAEKMNEMPTIIVRAVVIERQQHLINLLLRYIEKCSRRK